MGKFTDTWLKRSKIEDGIYGDGDRLYLREQGVAKSWSFIYTDPAKRRRELGLDGYPSVSLASARKLAEMARDQIALGIDPIEVKQAKVAAAKAEAKTLADVCLEYIDARSSLPQRLL